jgi:threonine dehydrogenase-like Zn-dependent dehydrogenase
MKAIRVMAGARQAELVNLPEPRTLDTTQVRVKVLCVGLCGVDRAIFRGAMGRSPTGSESLIIGHEMVGRVVELGRGVRSVRLGDLVVATVRRGCGVCPSCLRGQGDLCYSGLTKDRGIHEADGFLAEFILEEEANLVGVPWELQPVAVLLEPLSLVTKATGLARLVQQRLPARCGHPRHGWGEAQWAQCKRILVTGAGTLGLLSTLFLRAAGSEVHVYSLQGPDSPEARIVRLAGGEYIGAERVPPRALGNWVNQVGLVLETTGEPALLPHLPPVMARNAAMVLMGASGAPEGQASSSSYSSRLLAEANRSVLGCASSSRAHFEEAVTILQRLVGAFPNTLPQLITHRFPIERFAEALDQAGPSTIKVVVELA